MSRTPSLQTKDWQIKFLTAELNSLISLGYYDKAQAYTVSQQARRVGFRLGLEIYTSFDQRDGHLTAQKLKGPTISKEICTQAVILHLQAKSRIARKEQKLTADKEIEQLYTAKVRPASSSRGVALAHQLQRDRVLTYNPKDYTPEEMTDYRETNKAVGLSVVTGTLAMAFNDDGTTTIRIVEGD